MSEYGIKPNMKRIGHLQKLNILRTQNKSKFHFSAVQNSLKLKKDQSKQTVGLWKTPQKTIGEHLERRNSGNWKLPIKWRKLGVWYAIQPTEKLEHQRMHAFRDWERQYGMLFNQQRNYNTNGCMLFEIENGKNNMQAYQNHSHLRVDN